MSFKSIEEAREYWDWSGIEHPVRIVVCAANRREDGLILCGARHWDGIMCAQADAIGWDDSKMAEQGFIDQFGIFLTREEAREIALASGQKLRNPEPEEILFSEDLY